jgi:hypothetical protein
MLRIWNGTDVFSSAVKIEMFRGPSLKVVVQSFSEFVDLENSLRG